MTRYQKLFIWLNDFDQKWYIDDERWAGSWGSQYYRIAGPFDTKEQAQDWLDNQEKSA